MMPAFKNQFSPTESTVDPTSRCRNTATPTKKRKKKKKKAPLFSVSFLSGYLVFVLSCVFLVVFVGWTGKQDTGGVGARRKNVIKLYYMTFFNKIKITLLCFLKVYN